VKARVTITAAPLNGPGNEGTLGETRGTTVYLDRNAAGSGWYFDTDLADNTEFADRSGLSQLVGGPAQDVDFYSTVVHEIGHALGFSDAKSPFRSGRLRDTNLAAVVPAGTTTWTDPASLNGTYRYRVKAVFSPDGRGAGVDFPQPATGRAPGGTGTDDFRVTIGTSTGLPELHWSVGKQVGIRDVSGIRIYRAVDTGTADRNVAGAAVVAEGLGFANGVGNFADATAPIGVPCRYWIVGVVRGKHGFPDTELSIGYSVVATRPNPSFGAGTVRLVHNGSDTNDQREPIQIEWDPVPGATGYVVHVTGTNQVMTSHSYSYDVQTGTTAMWGFAGSSRLWVTAWVGGQSILVGSVVGWMPHGNETTADASGITIRNDWGNPSPQYIDIFRTTSSDDLTSVVPEFIQRISGSLGSTFVDTTATPGVAYYYWMLDYFGGGGGEWLVIGNGPTVRP
jgi:hypothetical protein